MIILKKFQKKLDNYIFMLTRANWGISRRCVEQFAELLDYIERGNFTKEKLLNWMIDKYSFIDGIDGADLYWTDVLSKFLRENSNNILELKACGRAFLFFKKILGKKIFAAILRFMVQKRILGDSFSMFMLVPTQYLWFKRNAQREYFSRSGVSLQDKINDFVRTELPRLHKRYEIIDAIILFSGGPDSLLATIRFARENPDKQILLLTVFHYFHYYNRDIFLNYYKKLLESEKNIIGLELMDITTLFDLLNQSFKDKYFRNKLRPCITCKMLMVYLLDIILASYKNKGSSEKYIVTGYRGPENKTFFPQTKRFDVYAKRCINNAHYVSPIWNYFVKEDVFSALREAGIKDYNRYKGIECCGPLTWDENRFKYGRYDFELLEEIINKLNSLNRGQK